MSEKIVLTFKTTGEVQIQDEPGQNAEKRLKFLLNGLGNIERRGHKHGAKEEAGVKIGNG
jgi:hypothetical protein